MRLKIIVIIAFLLNINTACRKNNNSSDNCYDNSNAQTITHNNEIREFILHIPNSYNGSVKYPVMLNFHGYGGSASDHMQAADMRSLADNENFILVYPQGTCLDGAPHWNASLSGPGNKSNADDLGFIDALINHLNSNYNIDLERVYACGYSNGGMFSYALACYNSNLIAAIGSVSGTMIEGTPLDCSPTHPTAMINIHGTSDNVLPYNGTTGYESIQSVIDYWVNYNNADANPTFDSFNDNGTNIEHYLYANGDSSSRIEHYKVIGGDHVWFDMNYQGMNTNDLIWNFVSQYDINGLR